MADTQNPSVRVGRMDLRIPAASAEAGQRVAQSVTTLLGRGLPGVERALGALNIRVSVPPGATESDIGSAIADSIRKALIRSRR